MKKKIVQVTGITKKKLSYNKKNIRTNNCIKSYKRERERELIKKKLYERRGRRKRERNELLLENGL